MPALDPRLCGSGVVALKEKEPCIVSEALSRLSVVRNRYQGYHIAT